MTLPLPTDAERYALLNDALLPLGQADGSLDGAGGLIKRAAGKGQVFRRL